MKRLGLLLALVPLGLAACGDGGAPTPDAGDAATDAASETSDGPVTDLSPADAPTSDAADADAAASDAVDTAFDFADATTFETLPTDRRSYVVTATLTVTPPPNEGGGWPDFPKTHTFTLAWDPAGGRVVASAGGLLASQVTTVDDRTFRATAPLSLSVPFADSCEGVAQIQYDDLEFGVEGGSWVGAGRGTATYQTGDVVLSAAVTATFTSVADTVAPSVALPTGPVDPLAAFTFPTSEPLPLTASASLVGMTSGDVISLNQTYVAETDHAFGAFTKRNVALRFGETYELQTTGFVDLAGNAPTTMPKLTTAAAPPLAAQDGFESLTTSMFGGAGVLRGGPLTPITGSVSLLLNTGFGGGFGFLPYDLGSSLAVRLAVPVTATVVRFEAQLIAPDPIDQATFVGAIRLGGLGEAVSSSMNVAGANFARVALPGNGDVFVSPVQTVTFSLPATDDGLITFEIVGVTFACGLPPSPTVLVLDNLRVE
jgi:hypothetical protein